MVQICGKADIVRAVIGRDNKRHKRISFPKNNFIKHKIMRTQIIEINGKLANEKLLAPVTIERKLKNIAEPG